MKQITERDAFNIRFLFYRLGMGAPSIAPVLDIPIGMVEKFCKKLPTSERRRQIQLRTRYAGRHRHYESRQKRLDESAVAALYRDNGYRYDNMRPSEIMSLDDAAFDPVADMMATMAAFGTACASRGDGYIEIGTDTVTVNRLSAIVTSLHARNRCRIGSE